ncbi:MAG: tRNA pseudouridine(38-40) synthase TruA [Proteobacteria bacterium]|nr:tRNA pseudouridine(38-40) synthase TruA [Pseudomonadota bacterium]
MTRYKLTLEYDGRGFVGWQRQDNGPSVQAALEAAVKGFCGEAITVHGAGRTDAGVHALAQVAHIDLEKETGAETLRDALNFHLKPAAVAVLAAEAVADDFHARFSATERAYRYRIVNRRAPLTLDRGRAWLVPVPLDAGAMGEAARALLGRHDFTSFRAGECQAKSPVKTLDALEVSRDGDEIWIEARARSFLHHQVRNMVGTLKLVGEGKWSRADMARALAARDRRAAGPTAPADGLYLVAVRY